MNPAIVVLAYNRRTALSRLLNALGEADYPCVPQLVISVESGAPQDVIDLVDAFSSEKLNVQKIYRKEKLGLRAHVMACGALSAQFGSVIILEDDLFVDRFFYHYAAEALCFYKEDEDVCGIALYSYRHNEFTGLPFSPMQNGYTTYPMQLACSWGQCWTEKQWDRFISWFDSTDRREPLEIEQMPDSVKTWPESSWKKYFQSYMVEEDKWFIYPYSSFSTNCSDTGGTHIRIKTSIHHVDMPSPERPLPQFNFSPENYLEVAYDAFMEPVGEFVTKAVGLGVDEVEMDLQGAKPISLLRKKKYVVTIYSGDHALKNFEAAFRPPELNLAFPSCGRNNQEQWSLVESKCLKDGDRRAASVGWLSYFAGMNLLRRDIPIPYARALAAKVLRKATSAFRKRDV